MSLLLFIHSDTSDTEEENEPEEEDVHITKVGLISHGLTATL